MAHRVDAAVDRRVRDDAAAPHGSDQIVLADDALAVAEQMQQQIEYLRLDLNDLAAAAQLAPLGIEQMIGKLEPHLSSLLNRLEAPKK